MTEKMAERTFLAVYGSPALQAAVRHRSGSQGRVRCGRRRRARCIVNCCETRIAELRSQIETGGLREAHGARRCSMSAWRGGLSDERGFEAIRRMRLATTEHQRLTLAQFKAIVREQFFMLLIDQEAALAAIPALLPPDADERQAALAAIREVLSRRAASRRRGRRTNESASSRCSTAESHGSASGRKSRSQEPSS